MQIGTRHNTYQFCACWGAPAVASPGRSGARGGHLRGHMSWDLFVAATTVCPLSRSCWRALELRPSGATASPLALASRDLTTQHGETEPLRRRWAGRTDPRPERSLGTAVPGAVPGRSGVAQAGVWAGVRTGLPAFPSIRRYSAGYQHTPFPSPSSPRIGVLNTWAT